MPGSSSNASLRSPSNQRYASTRSARSIRSVALGRPVSVGDYLARRLRELGMGSVHGAAHAKDTPLLKHLLAAGLHWTDHCNELNAANAADGYARIKGISALVSSYGAGELSALSAMAASYAEYVPVVHIVNAPPLASQKDTLSAFDVLNNGNSNTYIDMFRPVSCVITQLTDPFEIPGLIDHALRECWVRSRPVYVSLPADIVQRQVEGERLRQPIDVSPPSCDLDKVDFVVQVILRYLGASHNAVILVDACAMRHRVVSEVHDLAHVSGLPTFVTPMGKGAVTESLPNYCGVYAGDGSEDAIRRRVEIADLVLNIGAVKMDFSTAAFRYRASGLNTIDIHADSARVRYSEYTGVQMYDVLHLLVNRISQAPVSRIPGPTPTAFPSPAHSTTDHLTHAWFWKALTHFLKPNDIVVTETGPANVNIWRTRFPKDVAAINQYLWSSPGYATPACLGAAIAAQDLARDHASYASRTMLFTDSVGFAASASALSSMIRHKLKTIVFILRDSREALAVSRQAFERKDSATDLPHGSPRSDLAPWSYRDLLPAMGAKESSCQTCTIRTKRQAQALFADSSFAAAGCLQLVELHMSNS